MLLGVVGEAGADEEVTEVCFERDEHREKGVEIATGCSDSGDLATDHEVFVIPGPCGVARLECRMGIWSICLRKSLIDEA